MSTTPAIANVYKSLGPGQVIGLFLTRLLACLMDLAASGKTSVPASIAHMAASADAMVQSFIRTRAAAQLHSASFTEIARAMRTPPGTLRKSIDQIESETATPAELIERLEPVIKRFEQAEALASTLASTILCALAILLPEARRCPSYALPFVQPRRVGLGPPTITVAGQGPPYVWPPPYPPIPVSSLRRCQRQIGFRLSHKSQFVGPQAKHRRRCASVSWHSIQQLNKKRGRDPSAAIHAHPFCVCSIAAPSPAAPGDLRLHSRL